MSSVAHGERRRGRAKRKKYMQRSTPTIRNQVVSCWKRGGKLHGDTDIPVHRFRFVKQFPTSLVLLTQRRFTEKVQTFVCVCCGTTIEKTTPITRKDLGELC